MTPKQLRRLTQSKIQELEESLSSVDRRSFNERAQDMLVSAYRHLHAASAARIDRELGRSVVTEVERANEFLCNLPVEKSFIERVQEGLSEITGAANAVELKPDEATAYHEAGHFVVGVANGATVGELISCCERELEGHGLVWGYTDLREYPSIEARIMTLFAGPLAELRYTAAHTAAKDFRFDPNYVPIWGDRLSYGRVLVPWDAQTRAEFQQAHDILQVMGQVDSFPTLLSTTQKTLNCSNVWQAVEQLAQKLFKAGELTGKDAAGSIEWLIPPPPPTKAA